MAVGVLPMRRVIVSVMFVILLTMINALPASAGWYDGDTSLFICITYPEGEYRLGSEVQFTVHVFSRGEYIEPDSLNVTVGIGSPDPLDMEVTEVSTGMYTGSFTASLDHVVPGSDSVDIHAEVELSLLLDVYSHGRVSGIRRRSRYRR